MRIFKNKLFDKWAHKEGITDKMLRVAVAEMEDGLIDADLGGNVYKKRVALQGRGKRGGARTLLAYRIGKKAFFMYGFSKNELENIDSRELKALKQLAAIQLAWTDEQLALALQHEKVFEVIDHD
ncbi:MAG: type II toxin-antitoxin system RelE/ParE family toxin [Pseudomonadales bacterium]|nr:type II toxin-antitoxin system RelE/ParE family toxin [Pseudomonadales bacterium]